jgi:molybdopterin converting factor small subunit
LPASQLKVAVNAAFSDWNQALADGDEVVFIPPVAGG